MAILAVVALAAIEALVPSCGGSNAESAPTHQTPGESPMPAAIDVCVHVDGASPQPARATPSRAGVYDPAEAIDPALLNWTTHDFGCVSWPGENAPRVDCGGGAPRPRVVMVLCQQ